MLSCSIFAASLLRINQSKSCVGNIKTLVFALQMKYNNFLIFVTFKRSMLLSIFKIFNIILTIYTNIVIIFYVEYHREYKFLYSIFQASVL